jgi:opacity protein-like surface antigen
MLGRWRVAGRSATLAGLILAGSVLAGAALADDDGLFGLGNPLNFYVGASIGAATVHEMEGILYAPPGEFLNFSDRRFGWKVMAGIRPISWLGGEIEYLDLGSTHLGSSLLVPGDPGAGEVLGASSTTRAGAGFAMGYLPLPVSWMDVFGKVGVARLQTPSSYTVDLPADCSPSGSCSSVDQIFVANHPVDTGAGYGAGAQVHFNAFAVRAEYERINTGIGNPYLLSIGFTWTP